MTTASLPTLRVTGALTGALTAPVLAQLGSEQLAAFLLQRRWFGGKGRAPARVRIGDVIEIDRDGVRTAVARLDVDVGGGRTVYYQLPLAVRPDGRGEAPASVLARVEGDGERGVLFDAVEDERFRATLGRAFAAGAALGGAGGSRLVVERITGEGTTGHEVAGQPSRTVRAEQSNTSIIFGDVAIMKLFRRLEPGINPDVEIGRFLTTKTHFAHTPPLLGIVRYEGRETHSVAGMLQGFLPGSSDAWQYALEGSRSWFAAADDDAVHPFAGDAEQLGRITRELHDALASARDDEEFVPRRAQRADVQRWADNARRRIEDATALIRDRLGSGRLPDERSARGIVDDQGAYLSRLDELVSLIGDDAGELIRHHGDYHLGQVLRTRDGDFQIIDFEGEPARPLAERRERNSALRDVAGMLRSFAYAAATLAAEQRGRERDSTEVMERRAAVWERGAREAFLRGYLAGASAPFLPATPQRVDALRELFETEKVFYEMSYELNNRPDWVWIPIAGAASLRATPAGRS